ncbi:MAG: helix-turn-helix transcriptional regulator [Gammaproteobacteria bacterium]|nr:helix-turn-helix transcriptional regulator [Gammaproteobacteria bacterium]
MRRRCDGAYCAADAPDVKAGSAVSLIKPGRAIATVARDEHTFLQGVGSRVRELRERRGMTRRALAQEAEVSERYLGLLETGEGNMSIVLLRRVTSALSARLSEVLEPGPAASTERRLIARLLESVPPHRLEGLILRLMRDYGREEAARRQRIALIGLRGAGKSTLGPRLAAELRCHYVELDAEIERDSGLPLAELFSLYGQAGFRRFERRCLERVLAEPAPMVLAAGGGIVAEGDTFDLLLAHCYTVWLRASPEEHMARVIAQGDLRPMAGNAEAMDDLRRILIAREPLYRKADVIVETAGLDAAASLVRLRAAINP